MTAEHRPRCALVMAIRRRGAEPDALLHNSDSRQPDTSASSTRSRDRPRRGLLQGEPFGRCLRKYSDLSLVAQDRATSQKHIGKVGSQADMFDDIERFALGNRLRHLYSSSDAGQNFQFLRLPEYIAFFVPHGITAHIRS